MSLSLDGEIRVLTSDGGERALLKMRVEQPDLVVLDVMMPGMDGPTLLTRMRADPDLARHPGDIHDRQGECTRTRSDCASSRPSA